MRWAQWRRLLIVAAMVPCLGAAMLAQTSIYVLGRGGIFTTPVFYPDGTASAPSIAFASAPSTGFYQRVVGNAIGVAFQGTALLDINTATTLLMGNGGAVGWGSAAGAGAATADVILRRDAAAVLAQRDGTNAQAFRVYGTFTDASNYERLSFRFAGGDFVIGTQQAGTGTARNLDFETNNTLRWAVQSSGHIIASTDNTLDIGANGANRPRTGYFGTSVVAPFYNGPTSSIIASAATIAPTGNVHHISGTAAIATITVPAGCTPTCQITLIPDGLWTTTTGGNISLASTAVVNKALTLTWDGTKWNPNY